MEVYSAALRHSTSWGPGNKSSSLALLTVSPVTVPHYTCWSKGEKGLGYLTPHSHDGRQSFFS